MVSLAEFFIDFFISNFINKKPNYSIEHINYKKILLKTYISSK